MWPPDSQFSLARRHGACPQRDSLLSWNSFGARNIIFMVCQGIKYDSDQSFVWLQMHECVLLGDYFHLCSGHFIINISMRVHYQPKVLLPRKWQDLITPCCREAGLAATIFYFLYKAFSWALSFVCLFLRLLGFFFVVVCFWVVSVLTSVEWDVHNAQLEQFVCRAHPITPTQTAGAESFHHARPFPVMEVLSWN